MSFLPVLIALLGAATIDPAGTPSGGPPPAPPGEANAGVDAFGTRNLYPAAPGGRTWHAKWRSNGRVLKAGEMDPLDPEFEMRGSRHTLRIPGDGTAHSSGDVVRFYVGDPAGAKRWRNVEVTLYGMRVAEERDAGTAAGFSVQARTGPGHTSEAARNAAGRPIQCDGRSYGFSLRVRGDALVEKELKHPHYTRQVTRPAFGGEPLPKNRWVGLKLVLVDLEGGRVKQEIWVDLTDGADGGRWEKVLEHVDAGGWGIDPAIAATCGIAPDHVIREAGPSVVLRNDGVVEQRFKKVTVREIAPARDGSTTVPQG